MTVARTGRLPSEDLLIVWVNQPNSDLKAERTLTRIVGKRRAKKVHFTVATRNEGTTFYIGTSRRARIGLNER